MTLKSTSLLLFLSLILSCNSNKSTKPIEAALEQEKIVKSEAEKILENCIKAHGGDAYNDAHFAFTFRDNIYTFKNKESNFIYSKIAIKNGESIADTLNNIEFTRHINGIPQTLNEKETSAYANSLNSVIYFALLPYKLKDPAVMLTKGEDVNIKGQKYHALNVSFKQDGGGKDFDDNYIFWINKDSNTMDYFAYNYTVNKGGVRFRAAYNGRKVKGVLFQDYINYKAEVGTELKDLPAIYSANKLLELSKIETENIKAL